MKDWKIPRLEEIKKMQPHRVGSWMDPGTGKGH